MMKISSIKSKYSQSGFTLIELLVVVVIIGILSGIAVVAVGNAKDRAASGACRAAQAELLKAFDMYYLDNSGKWPSTGTATPDAASAATSWTSSTTLVAAFVPTYLKSFPPYGSVLPAGSDYALTASVVKPASGPSYISITSVTSNARIVCPALP